MNLTRLILDTNLLVLYVVGTASRKYISMHKRLTQFNESDYDLLLNIISKASIILVTPNTLTETSNLSAYIAEPAKSHIFEVLQYVIQNSQENYLNSSVVASRPEFIRLGLTDASLIDLSSNDGSLLTTDLNLYLAALANGSAATNFNHLRDASMQ